MISLSLCPQLAIFILSHVTPLKKSPLRTIPGPLYSSAPINCSSAAISNVTTLPATSYFLRSSSLHPSVQSSSQLEQNLICRIHFSSFWMVVTIFVIFLDWSKVWLAVNFSVEPLLTDLPSLKVIASVATKSPPDCTYCNFSLLSSCPLFSSRVFSLGIFIVPVIFTSLSVPTILVLLMKDLEGIYLTQPKATHRHYSALASRISITAFCLAMISAFYSSAAFCQLAWALRISISAFCLAMIAAFSSSAALCYLTSS